MQLVNSTSLPSSLASQTQTRNPKIQPQLSMVWVKEFDGNRERLVAKWVTQD